MSSVLIVDDDPAIREMLSAVLFMEGYNIQTAEHGAPALAIMHASPERLVVTLGLIMPEVTGLDVLEAVAADEALTRQHAIIMVTGQGTMASHGRIKQLRDQLGVPLVEKPFTIEQLLDAVTAAEQRLAT